MTTSKILSIADFENNDEDTPDKQQIYEVCMKGSLNDLTDCFKHGEDAMSAYIKDGMTPLHLVVIANRMDAEAAIDMLLKNGSDVNALTKSGDDTVLHLVVRETEIRKAFPLVLKILEFHPDLTIRNRKLRTPYDLAIARGYYELAQVLDGHMTPHEAREFYTKKIGALYGRKRKRAKAKIIKPRPVIPLSPEKMRELQERLIDAVVNSKEKEIEEFLKYGADPNFKNELQNGPIHYAVTHCTLPPKQTLTSLIHAGADVNLTDDEGDTALNLIIKSGRLRESGEMYKCAELLVNQGALSTFQDLDGKDAMALATQRQYQDIVKLLRRSRQDDVREEFSPIPGPSFAEPEFDEEEYEPPPAYEERERFQLSMPRDRIEEQEPEEESETQEEEEEEEEEDDFVHPPPAPADAQSNLLTAIQQGTANAVSAALRDPNADPNKQDQNGIYPLHYAVIREEIEDDERYNMIDILLQAGVDVNVKTKDKQNTPLHIAATVDQRRTVKQLLDTHTCNYNQKNRRNQMPYDLAKEEGNREVMEIIDAHRAAVRGRMRNAAKKASFCIIL